MISSQNSPLGQGEWNNFYSDAREELPGKMKEPLGDILKVTAYVDANHTGNQKQGGPTAES